MNIKKIERTIAAFVAGACTIPLVMVVWPLALAIIAWNEFDKVE